MKNLNYDVLYCILSFLDLDSIITVCSLFRSCMVSYETYKQILCRNLLKDMDCVSRYGPCGSSSSCPLILSQFLSERFVHEFTVKGPSYENLNLYLQRVCFIDSSCHIKFLNHHNLIDFLYNAIARNSYKGNINKPEILNCIHTLTKIGCKVTIENFLQAIMLMDKRNVKQILKLYPTIITSNFNGLPVVFDIQRRLLALKNIKQIPAYKETYIVSIIDYLVKRGAQTFVVDISGNQVEFKTYFRV